MRAICKASNEQSNCSYLKRCKEGERIDVQTSDFGYEEAIEKATAWLESAINGDNIEGCKDSNKLIDDFKKYMEL